MSARSLRSTSIVALALGALLVPAASAAVVRPQVAAVPAANGTAACREARDLLIELNRLVAPLRRGIDQAVAAKKRDDVARLVDLGRRLQRRIDAAAAAARRDCAAPNPPAGNGERPAANAGPVQVREIRPPTDNGTAGCREASARIRSLNAQVAVALRNYEYRRASRPQSEEAKRAKATALEQIEERLRQLDRALRQADETARAACAIPDFSGTWTGTYNGKYLSDTPTCPEVPVSGKATFVIRKTSDTTYSVTQTFEGINVKYTGPTCAITSRTNATSTVEAVVDKGTLRWGIFSISGTTLSGVSNTASQYFKFEATR